MGDRLQDRVCVITGAGRGIGAATAVRFAREGAALVLNDVDAEPLGATAEAVTRTGPVVTVVGDCASRSVAEQIAHRALDRFDGLDVLINNAGTLIDAPFGALDDDDWERVLAASLTGTRRTTAACAAVMQQKATQELVADGCVAHGRRIVTTVAAGTLTGAPGGAATAVAGGGIHALTRTLARELGGFGITVNAVVPGFVQTRLTEPETADRPGTGVAEPVRQMTKAMTALGRWGRPEDVAAVHLFLASRDADFVTGALLPVTGGLLGTLR